jgi:hypothetical protein
MTISFCRKPRGSLEANNGAMEGCKICDKKPSTKGGLIFLL